MMSDELKKVNAVMAVSEVLTDAAMNHTLGDQESLGQISALVDALGIIMEED